MDIRELPEWQTAHNVILKHGVTIIVEFDSKQVIEWKNTNAQCGSLEELVDDQRIGPDIVAVLNNLAKRVRNKFLGFTIRIVNIYHTDEVEQQGLHIYGESTREESDWSSSTNRGLKIEIAETLKGLEDLLQPEEYRLAKEQVLKIYPDFLEKDLMRVVRSLREEDEFALMCRLMGACTSIARLDQKHVIDGDYSVPDYIASFRPGCHKCGIAPEEVDEFKCFIEVKTCFKNPEAMKVKNKNLKQLRNYVEKYDLPLLFAVRFTSSTDYAFWAMVEDNGEDEILIPPQAVFNGVRHFLWNELFFQVEPGVEVSATFDDRKRNSFFKGDGGHLSHFTFTKKGVPYTVYDGFATYSYMFFSMPNLLTNKKSEELGILTTNYGVTAGTVEHPLILTTADVIYEFNNRITNLSGEVGYPASQVLLPRYGKTGEPLINKSKIMPFLVDLQRLGIIKFCPPVSPDMHKQLCERFNVLSSQNEL